MLAIEAYCEYVWNSDSVYISRQRPRSEDGHPQLVRCIPASLMCALAGAVAPIRRRWRTCGKPKCSGEVGWQGGSVPAGVADRDDRTGRRQSRCAERSAKRTGRVACAADVAVVSEPLPHSQNFEAGRRPARAHIHNPRPPRQHPKCPRKRATAVRTACHSRPQLLTDPVYVKGRHIGYQRSKRNTNPSVSLLQLEGVDNTQDARWYLGKRVAYVYRANKAVRGSKIRVIWGKIRSTHGLSSTSKHCIALF